MLATHEGHEGAHVMSDMSTVEKSHPYPLQNFRKTVPLTLSLSQALPSNHVYGLAGTSPKGMGFEERYSVEFEQLDLDLRESYDVTCRLGRWHSWYSW